MSNKLLMLGSVDNENYFIFWSTQKRYVYVATNVQRQIAAVIQRTSDNVYGVALYDNKGSREYEKLLPSTSYAITSINYDNAGDVHVGMRGSAQWMKLDGSFNPSFIRVFGGTATEGNPLKDGSCIHIYSSPAAASEHQIAKVNSSNVKQWADARTCPGDYEGSNYYPGELVINDYAVNDSVSVVGGYMYDGSIDPAILCYNNSNGGLIYQGVFSSAAMTNILAIAVNSSNEAVIQSDYSGATLCIVKLNSSGTAVWGKIFSGFGNSNANMCFDVDGNLYVVLTYTISSNNAVKILKFDPNGTLLWERDITVASANVDKAVDPSCDVYGNLYITFSTHVSGTNYYFLMKVPGDGSLTGSYAINGFNLSYAVTSNPVTVASGTPSRTHYSYLVASNNNTPSTNSFSLSTVSLTETLIDIDL